MYGQGIRGMKIGNNKLQILNRNFINQRLAFLIRLLREIYELVSNFLLRSHCQQLAVS